jgi:hypothetical protein
MDVQKIMLHQVPTTLQGPLSLPAYDPKHKHIKSMFESLIKDQTTAEESPD